MLTFVPTLGISDGWLDATSAATKASPTIPLLGPRNWSPVQPIPSQWAGAVATYQSLFTSTEMFLAHATDPGHKTLVIFDEIHHAGVDSGWGISAQEAFHKGATASSALRGLHFARIEMRSSLCLVITAAPYLTIDMDTIAPLRMALADRSSSSLPVEPQLSEPKTTPSTPSASMTA